MRCSQNISKGGLLAACVVAGCLMGRSAGAQQMRVEPGSVSVGGALPSWVTTELMDADEAQVQRYRALQGEQRALRQELRRLRVEFFRDGNPELRQIGISKLRRYTDPAGYPVLLEVFEREPMEVRTAILDMLADQRSGDADTALAWVALFDRDEAFRAEALERLSDRVDETGSVPPRVAYLVERSLRKSSDRDVAAGARLADNLSIVGAIPHMINAQVAGARGGSVGSGGEPGGALGWIMVGRQVAFVEDLQPVVADAAVAFDPQLNVISEGVVVRALGASVITYRTEVNSALVGLASRASDRDLSRLGWDQRAWWDWYRTEFEPMLRREGVDAVRDRAIQAASQDDEPTVPIEGLRGAG